ncbi:DUF2138 domain-containing protein [Pseudomonas fluorescens]|uniref:DUF2138 domain-containing protein n=1 Tax=Pseudomonas fluorescens TaxID=294 RepID=A0A944DK69_PSEFL|nr:DUF2138 domain-containing protein [Pseudomonas fluorescens]MBT2312037.1 DUF2138 domain-containing protein [Pseudomonas fluorescens]MBT2316988.1 DUF2138 domain-containing protein [Pseudomonas fluorescens]MBT2327200.1 DUF2138 domain-containing protein [Pseudomonas fluorescens]MBT2344807.1 DUF2138 domain-containing protein [Pseudomonas fluorescens]MBT2347803.1 DUF2138 domain-containing protein [Pseudomonas fluorescens]
MSDNTASPTVPTPAAKPARRWPALLIGLSLVAGVAAGLGWFMTKPKAPPMELALEKLGLSRPDGLLEAHSLSQLPKDLLAVPFLKATLTEDFVFYYETHADRLGLIGSLRRIIYEHDLKLQDSLIEQLFDQPADVALWRGADGRLKDFLLVMDRGGLAKVLEPLAKVALDDSQLSQLGEMKVAGDVVPVYQLTYNASKALVFASHGDKLVVLSNPTRLYDLGSGPTDEPGMVSTQALEALLAGEKLFPEAFGLLPKAPEVKQRISVNASVLAMGYQRFIPNFAGLRFDMDDNGWHSFLAMDELEDQPDFDFKPIWQAMPMGASACVALPLAAEQQKPLLVKLGAADSAAQAMIEHMAGAAGLCWYADSRLYTPLLVANLNDDGGKLDADLGNLFGSMVGAYENNVAEHAFAVVETQEGPMHRWQRQVSSNFGPYPAKEAAQPEAITGKAFMQVSLARHGSTLLFSLDDKLVDKALGTLDKRFPPMADVVPKDLLMPVYFGPDAMAQLMQRETLDSLPQDMEPVFYNAAQTYLIPKLRTLGGYGKYALTLPEGSEPDGHWQWLPLEWKAL